jgi:haloalkane dehalogenase
MDTARAADEQFAKIPVWPYAPRSMELEEKGGPRMAYVAEGALENRPVLLLHGGPTWGYLWRRPIPSFVAKFARRNQARRLG